MEPPPTPPSGRFRLRIQIVDKQDVLNPNAAPQRQFTIAKNANLPLPNLTLKQLCTEVVKRFQQLYPGESLFTVDKAQDSSRSDLWLGERVCDIFEDNDILRLIKRASIRSSIDLHRSRSPSVKSGQGNHLNGTYTSTFGAPPHSLNSPRLYGLDPDHPVNSRERVFEQISADLQTRPGHFASSQLSIIPDSQQSRLRMHNQTQGTWAKSFFEITSSIPESSIAESGYDQNGPRCSQKTATSQRSSQLETHQLGHVAASDDGMGPLFNGPDEGETAILQKPSIAANRRLSKDLQSGRAVAEIINQSSLSGAKSRQSQESESESFGAAISKIKPLLGHKRKLSHDEDRTGEQQRSMTSITPHRREENRSTAKKLKRVTTLERPSKSISLKNVYEDFATDNESVSVKPKGTSKITPPRTSSNHSGSLSENDTIGRGSCLASISRNAKSSPIDETEQLCLAKEAPHVALAKHKSDAASEKPTASEIEREWRIASQREDEEKLALEEGKQKELERGNNPVNTALKAKERRGKAAWARELAKNKEARLKFEAERRRISRERELEQERRTADHEESRLRAEAKRKREAEAEEERKRVETERNITEAKQQREMKAASKLEAEEIFRKAAAERTKIRLGARANMDADRAAKDAKFHLTQQKLAEAKADRDAAESAIREASANCRIEVERKMVSKAGSGKELYEEDQNKFEAISKAKQAGKAKEQHQPVDSAETKKPSPSSSGGGMLARAVREHEVATAAASKNNPMERSSINSMVSQTGMVASCTPYIPRGKPAGSVSASQASSQAAASPSLQLPSATGVGIEAQMPLPSSSKRSVSFAGDSGLASKTPLGHLTKKLKQTTLIPPRPTHRSIIATKKPFSSKASKGKGKLVETPGTPPHPIIISSDESSSYSDIDSDDLEITHDELSNGRADGPAYSRGHSRGEDKPSSAQRSSLRDTSTSHPAIQVDGNIRPSTPNTSPPRAPTRSQINPITTPLGNAKDILRRVSNLGFPTPAHGSLQSSLELNSRASNLKINSTSPQELKHLSEIFARTNESLQRARNLGFAAGSSLKTPNSLPDSKLQQPVQLVAKPTWDTPSNMKMTTSGTVPASVSQAEQANSISSSPPALEMPPRPKAPSQALCTRGKSPTSPSTQSEVDQQLLSHAWESASGGSFSGCTSSWSSGCQPPVKVSRGLARMTRERLAEDADKKAYANSELVLQAKREEEERVRRQQAEAAAELEMSSTESESQSDSDNSEDNDLEAGDLRVQGNLYNGTGFSKMTNRRIGISNAQSNVPKPRSGRKYQTNPKTGRMMKVGKYEYIDSKTGKIMENSRRILTCIRRKKERGGKSSFQIWR